MREIKIRFFDKESKQLSRGYTLDELKQIFSGTTGNAGVEAWFGFNWPTLIKSQFTGLKDKNKKEIFEGDIVSFELTDSSNNNLIGKGVIIWMEHESGWGIEEIRNTFFNIRFVKEVIGNIYENPELLEGGKKENDRKI